MEQKGRSKRFIKKVHKFSSDDEEVDSTQVKKNKVFNTFLTTSTELYLFEKFT